MGETTGIAWTDHTFNPWWGCVRVSPGCEACYAEAFAKRTGHGVWGVQSPRRFFGDAHWREPEKWNATALADGVRRRVFCASMADVFEDRADLLPHRARLFRLIEATPALDWQLLTKRPENFRDMLPPTWLVTRRAPRNVWLGCTMEDEQRAEERMRHMLAVESFTTFISFEPLLGPIVVPCGGCGGTLNGHRAGDGGGCSGWWPDWWIVGGESGPRARPCDVAWIRSLVQQCQEAGSAVFVKQDSGLRPGQRGRIPDELWLKEFPAIRV